MRRWSAPLIAWVLLAGCAQVREVSGGEADRNPPRLVSADPGNLTTEFNGERIVLRFDERLQLERASERILFSPPLSGTPKIRLSGPKEVTIELRSALLDSTTYVVTLGEAIKDLTEGNPTAGLEHVFSTGPLLDARTIAGKVINAYTGAAEKEVMVLLYRPADTADFRNDRPAYAVRVDAQGQFRFPHLPEGEFVLRALRDKNNNYRYDLPNEEIAFLGTAIRSAEPDSAQPSSVTLRLFQETSARQLIRDSRTLPDRSLRVVFARPAEEVRIRDIARTGGALRWTPEWNETRDTVSLWPSDTTLLGDGRYEVSTETGVVDTLRYRTPEKPEFLLGLSAVLSERTEGTEVVLTASRPVATFDDTRVLLMVDSIPVGYTIERSGSRLFRLKTTVASDRTIRITALPKALRDIHGGYNDTLSMDLGLADERSTGVIRVQLKFNEDPGTPLIVLLLDGQGRIVRSAPLPSGQRSITWARSQPGAHELRLIADRNGNGRWDTGDMDQDLQPERVWAYPEKVNIRAAWDIGLEWTVE